MEATIETPSKLTRGPRRSTVRPVVIDDRLSLVRREELRKLAEAALLDSEVSGKIQAYLGPDWGDVRKPEWQEMAVAALEASADLRAKLETAENRLDAICSILEDDPE